MTLPLESDRPYHTAFINCTFKFYPMRRFVLLRAMPLPLRLLMIISIISGCAPSFPAIGLGVGDTPPKNEAIVFGRIGFPDGTIDNLVETELTFGKDITGLVFIRNEKSSEIFSYYSKMNEGKCDLLWHLPPGDYLVLRLELTWFEGNQLSRSSLIGLGPKLKLSRTFTLLARFSVPPNESAVYIGNLRIDLVGNNYVFDSFENSIVTLRSQFPDLEIEPTKNLMMLEVVE